MPPQSSRGLRTRRAAHATGPAFESLENRRLFATVVRFATELGNIDVELFNTKPVTVANFLGYVNSGAFNRTFIHRATEPATGLEVVQGGGFTLDGFGHIPTADPIVNEGPNAPVLSNTRGTIAMARTSEPNSATSEWFINTVDNTSLDPGGPQAAGFAVFGQVINGTITTVDAIQDLPTFAFGGAFGEIPLRNYTQANFDANTTPTEQNFVSVTASLVSVDVTLGGAGNPTSVTYTDADGTRATISLKGPGSVTIPFDGTGLTQTTKGAKTTIGGTVAPIDDLLVLQGTTAATNVTITGKGGDGVLDFAGFNATGPLKALSAKAARLSGTTTLGGATKVDLNAITDTGSLVLQAQGGLAATVTVAGAAGGSIQSGGPLKSVTAGSFGAAAALTATSLDKVTSKGDFLADLTATGAIKSMTVAGNLAGNVTADSIGKLSVKGGLTGSTIRSAGSITSVTAASASGSAIYAGVAPAIVGPAGLPDDANDFAAPATLGTVSIKGAFAGTNIAAFTLNKVSLGTLTTTNGGVPFGVAADSIKSLSGSVGGPRLALKNLLTQADADAATSGASLGDFRIVVV